MAKSNAYIFPKLGRYVKETPLWLCLEYYGYEQYFKNRGNSTLGEPTKRFFLPLPSNIGSQCRIKASDDAIKLASTRAGYLSSDYPLFGQSTKLPDGQPPGDDGQGRYPVFPNKTSEISISSEGVMRTSNYNYGMFGALGDATKQREIPLSLGNLARDGKNNEGYVDIVDTSWYGSNKKAYKFFFDLTAKSIDCSEEAQLICNEFTNLILPAWGTANPPAGSSGSAGALYNRSTIHPGAWQPRVFAGAGQAGQEKTALTDATIRWLGNYPQPCLLINALAFRHGASETSISAMLKSDSTDLYPIKYSIELELQEIEPSYVANVDQRETTVSSRSKLLKAYPN
jgi:hypothetical protein